MGTQSRPFGPSERGPAPAAAAARCKGNDTALCSGEAELGEPGTRCQGRGVGRPAPGAPSPEPSPASPAQPTSARHRHDAAALRAGAGTARVTGNAPEGARGEG